MKWFVLALALAGCPRPIPTPPQPPPDQSGVATCGTLATLPKSLDVCAGLATPEGLQCVRCDVDMGCRFAQAEVYCTPSCTDPYCGGYTVKKSNKK